MKSAEAIIENIASGMALWEAGSFTCHGEYRIKNCVKFNLGSGYRLITSKWGVRLYVLYVGTHDECHRWLENNKGWRPESEKKRIESLPVENQQTDHEINRRNGLDSEDPQDYLNHIRQKDLRVIFRGLCGQ